MAFSQQGSRTVCILSANGAICNVTLRQPATSGGTVTYEGRFEIISLSGSFLLMENGGTRSRTGGLSVSLAGSDGRVLGGGVAGMLMAAGPVQVVVGSFVADGKKQKPERQPSLTPAPQIVGLGAPVATGSPPSQGASSESSREPGSPLNHSSGACNNNGQSIQSLSTYASMGWGTHSANSH
ncbi:AT-hook motif nuclear-localized protein 10-like [Macadamia integrifolia]|uniref:AT-hook motif nuclear-localized protein 10-like n=1 Tax=Macadamia integrifolia TaxID=60698 RepID=UPI001C4F7BDC|nr:AT-hook motif nuclear-localized protein 10-like [Macadamia integrifolia]